MPLSTEGTVNWASVSPSIMIEWPLEGRSLCVKSVSGDGEEGRWGVEKMESVGQAILKLVGTELKLSQIVGKFFIECLTCVAANLCQDLAYQADLASVKKEIKLMTSA